MIDFSKQIKNYFEHEISTIQKLNIKQINDVINVLLNARNNSKTIYIFGNGGSAATASHFVCDFIKGASYLKNKKFKMICLNDNIPTVMAFANDVSYNDIFIEQLKNLLNEGDIVIGISGSGNSKNVLNAIEYANNNGAISIGLSGYNGGKLKQIAQHNIHVNIDNMQITEDIHMILDHLIMSIFTNG